MNDSTQFLHIFKLWNDQSLPHRFIFLEFYEQCVLDLLPLLNTVGAGALFRCHYIKGRFLAPAFFKVFLANLRRIFEKQYNQSIPRNCLQCNCDDLQYDAKYVF